VIAHLRGVVAARDPGGLIVEVGGVGLRVNAPASTLARVGAPGSTVDLHTHLYVREDTLALYGFASQEERRAFEALLTVSGVGPRAALGILSVLSVEQLRVAIGDGNVDLLTAVPGIGKRIASRVVLDLKEKLGARGRAAATDGRAAALGPDATVLDALVEVFGYSSQQAAQAVAALGDEAPTEPEERLRAALRYFARSR
jgi:Holliday junction DNA helicase RuvA